MATTTAARSDSATFIPASFVSLQNPRIPKPFHGGYSEDAQDWLDQFERVARFNGWDDSAKIRNVYFSLEDAARIWYENRETSLTTWQDFRRQLLETYTSSDRHEQAERELTARIQLPNENVAMYVEEVTRLCNRADPTMTEEKKLRHLMRGVKEQLFCGLVRSPPRTVAEFLSEAVLMERVLQQGYDFYDRQLNPISALHPLDAASGANTSSLRDIVRSVVREELQKLQEIFPVDSLTSAIREEVQQALRSPVAPVEPPPQPAAWPPATYADVLRRPAPVPCAPPYAPSVVAVHAEQPVPYWQARGQAPRKTDIWRAPDRRPLCYHCGEAGHIFRRCPYRPLGLRGLSAGSPRPRHAEQPQEFDEYVTRRRGSPPPPRRTSRSPSPRHPSPHQSGYGPGAQRGSSSPHREN
ncbi:hypothetical protein V5799_023416 [Amblyomma americanum]|uniref:CCHC-type domain-containing protein n=1 Tax=Amblyomma americanum TaxID=6943 RepID=A0AAQ4FJE1_AMBAM